MIIQCDALSAPSGLRRGLVYCRRDCRCVGRMAANMLTEQNIVMEPVDSSDMLPIGFITTEDGHTLLAVAGKSTWIKKAFAATANWVIAIHLCDNSKGRVCLAEILFYLMVIAMVRDKRVVPVVT